MMITNRTTGIMEMREHLLNAEVSNNAADAEQKNLKYGFSSSESSRNSKEMGKDDPELEQIQTNLDSKGVEFSEDVSDFNPRMSSVQEPLTMVQAGGGYDPNRIPASVFASKPNTPMDWSVASNESLFSIHMGNSSFSRDHVFLIYKSGELSETNLQPSLFPVIETGNVEKPSEDVVIKHPKVMEERLPEPVNVVEPNFPVNNRKAGVSGENEPVRNFYQERISSPVEEVRHSTSSVHSFHFPIFEASVGGGNSVKVVMENIPSKKQLLNEPQSQKQASGTPRKLFGSTGWFSCFPNCCSLAP